MSDEEMLRLECLKLAASQGTPDQVIAAAKSYYDFVCPAAQRETSQ